MKNRVLALVCLAAMMLAGITTQAQQPISNNYGTYGVTGYKVNGQAIASQYAQWSLPSVAATAAGTFSFPPTFCQVQLGGGRLFTPFATKNGVSGTLPSVKIIDAVPANTETVTPSSITLTASLCVINMAPSNTHVSYTIVSGTCGLQEAINDLGTAAGVVNITQEFYDKGCTQSTITAAAGQNNQIVHDLTNDTWFALRPANNTLIAAPSAPTIAVATGGTLTTGAYLASQVCVDQMGNKSLASADSGSVSTTTGNQTLTFTPTTCGAGSVGYIPQITAAGGAGASEIDAAEPVTSAMCTLTALESVIPACALGVTATITANPSGTSKQPTFGTAHTAFAYSLFNNLPLQYQTVYLPFASVATVTSGSSNDLAQFYVPAGALNFLGKSLDICFKVNSTLAATAVPTWKLNATNFFNQSPVTLTTVLGTTQTGAVSNDVCFNLVTATTGASGNFWAGLDGALVQSLAAGASTTGGEGTSAVSSNLNLSKGLYFTLNLGATTANITSNTVEVVTIRPVPTT